MRLLAALLLVLTIPLAGACRKDSGGPAPSSPAALPATPTDALWKLAPAGLKTGVVAGDGALAHLHDGLTTFLAAFAAAPGGAEALAQIGGELAIGGVDLRDRAALTRAGFDLTRGAAAFDTAEGDVFVLPVGDRKALLAAFKGTSDPTGTDSFLGQSCREVMGRYACASNVAALDGLGKGDAAAEVASWPAAQRGHLEMLVAATELGEVDQGVGGTKGLRIGIQLERGGGTLRAHLTGTPKGPIATVAEGKRSPLIAPLLERGPSGVLVVDATTLSPLWIATTAELPESARIGAVSIRDLARSVRGDLVGWAEHGAPLRGQAAIGLVDEAPAKALVDACVLPMPVPMVSVAKVDGRCRVTVAAPGQQVVTDLWVEGGALRLGMGDYQAAGKPAALPAIGKALAADHQLALWGHGSALEVGDLTASLGQVPDAALALWAMAHLSELGLGVRVGADGVHGLARIQTTFANPPAVVAELEPLIAAFARSEAGALEKIRALAAKHPDAPLSADLRAGAGGLMPLVGGVGVLAAVSIPAFVKYTAKSKTSEAGAMVQRLHDGARAHYLGGAGGERFPAPSAGPTPPLGACCAQGERCVPDPAQWNAEPWRSLGFSVDEPSYYSYKYEVAADGKSFTATALGDLDCDGEYSTFSMKGDAAAGGTGSTSITRTNELE